MITTKTQPDGRESITVTILDREFVFINKCTHFNCDLSKGKIIGSSIVCTCGWQYDLLTGRALNQPLARLEKIE
jgi:nitrite reductase/ring-hydroxylating ferredoxin subunit